jgi:hypothetical protein
MKKTRIISAAAQLFLLALTSLAQTVQTAQTAPVCGVIAGGPIPASYLSGTKKCSTGETLGASTTHCADDGGIAATLATPATQQQAAVAGGGWATWSSPPFSEYPYPWVAFTPGPSNTIALSRAAGVLGLEIEPNVFNVFAVTATFLDANGNVLANITQNVNGDAGAAVFAAVCNRPAIKSVSVSLDPSAQGFAVAEIRSDKMVGIAAPTISSTPITAPVTPGSTSNH